MYDGFNISFEKIHIVNQKCTPSQIMLYKIAINLYKAINFEKCPTFEQINLLEQIVCGSRQLKFEIVMLLMLWLKIIYRDLQNLGLRAWAQAVWGTRFWFMATDLGPVMARR